MYQDASGLTLLAVMKLLGKEEVLDFVWDCVVRATHRETGQHSFGESHNKKGGVLVSKVWARLIRRASGAATLPSTDVDSVQVL